MLASGNGQKTDQKSKPLSKWIFSLVLLFSLASQAALSSNPIQIENKKPGTPDWELKNPAINHEIEGFANLTSVNRGGKIDFFVNTAESSFTARVFRMGWYGGVGAREIQTNLPQKLQGTHQKMPDMNSQTGLIECDWRKSFSLQIPSDQSPGRSDEWLSGVYVVKLTAASGKDSFMIFVVRDDQRHSPLIYQTAVNTYQAYNRWGGKSVYDFNSDPVPVGGRTSSKWHKGVRATSVSFNRPYALGLNPLAATGLGAGEFFTNVQPEDETHPSGWEYLFVRFMEREGFDVSYMTDQDAHARPESLSNHKGVILAGHNEYWSWEMRERFQNFLNSGGNIGSYSSNTCYWQVRMEGSPLTGAPGRTMTVYKDAKLDPTKGLRATTQWRQLGMPEQNLFGVQYIVDPADGDLQIADDGSHWLLEGTGLKKGDKIPGVVGYEADGIAGQPVNGTELIARSQWINHREKPGDDEYTGVADTTLLTTPGGGMVFASGGMNWSLALDPYMQHLHNREANEALQKLTCNFLLRASGRKTK